MMEVSPEIRKAYEQLLSEQTFCEHIEAYTLSALQTIFNQPQTQEIDCPPSYIFVLNHSLMTNQNINYFLSGIPATSRTKVGELIRSYSEEKADLKIANTVFNNLCDVKWEMAIENGRQVYEVQLFTQETEKPFIMRLSYEQLSILSFQVSQVMSRLASLTGSNQ